MDCEEERNGESQKGCRASSKVNLTSSPDCNSNNLTVPKENMLLYSTDSIHDYVDFPQDNSDYQWFLDYGYKDNNYFHHHSILSCSKTEDLVFYENMARNIDANLAEVDMDDFNREDINSVLSTLPNMQGIEEREMFASVSGSMMVKFDLDSSINPCYNSQEEQNCTSICKSQLLFSPVRESFLPNTNLSVDSLDTSENDINLMVTCQANKNNYTIAFEASTIMTSDDLETGENFDRDNKSILSQEEFNKNSSRTLIPSSSDNNVMARSDSTFTTWSKIKENSSENLQLRRHPSGNNNTNLNNNHCTNEIIIPKGIKSLSLPNLSEHKLSKQGLKMSKSVRLSNCSRSSFIEGQQQFVKLYDVQSICNSKNGVHSSLSSSGKSSHNFSLVKLFIKQKSTSNEGMFNYSEQNSTIENKVIDKKKNAADKKIEKIINENPHQVTHKQVGLENFKNENKACDSASEKYFSDESAQENGSNTESAENLTSRCFNSRPDFESKKLVLEKGIQTSKFLESDKSSQKKQVKIPVYILYPNYSLPNLEFLKKEHYIQNIDFSKIFLKPQKLKMPETPVKSPELRSNNQGKRPFSVNDIEALKKTGFKHIKDWESLTFLLPKECKQFLKDIPEIVGHLKDIKSIKEETVPLFCLSPPQNRKIRKRPSSCDVNFFNHDCRSSTFSSTNTQPSSGYRGSSTMLNSNNSNDTNSANKNYFIQSGSRNENPPPRPPLPRSILRNNSLDNHQYTCKTQKENANKRYSMIELSGKDASLEDKFNKRLSSQNCKSYRNKEPKHGFMDYGSAENKSPKANKSFEAEENHVFERESNLENDMKRLEELLEISAIFGESVASFTESDMSRLRFQVSKFLTMQKNLERVSETLQNVDKRITHESASLKNEDSYENDNCLNVKHLLTPHNTPEHKKQSVDHNKDFSNLIRCKDQNHSSSCNCDDHTYEFEDHYSKFKEENVNGLKKTVSFAEKIAFAIKEQESKHIREQSSPVSPGLLSTKPKYHQTKSKRPMDLPICEESTEGTIFDSPVRKSYNSLELTHKKNLILDVRNAVDKILKLQEDPANVCLHHLCPSLFAILSDGLKEEIDTPFGPIRNSVWSVVEASSQQGPMTQTLNELVQRINRDDIFTEGLIKFNAFIFGLLNAKALSGWFSYLRTRDSLLRKYYENYGLLLMSNTAGASFRTLVDQLLTIIEPLCSIQFNLDLMYQTKLLHCSLQNLNCLLEGSANTDFLTPTKQFMLLKLMQSIQNSLSQSGEGKKNRLTMEDIEQTTVDPPVSHLLEKNRNICSRQNSNKIRPRSGCDILGSGITDVASLMKKRWSVVQSNSKLVEAFDRLMDNSESDYTDSLDNTKPKKETERAALSAKNTQKESTASNSLQSKDPEVEFATKERKKNILLNLNKKSGAASNFNKTESEKIMQMDDSVTRLQDAETKFKRLQQKWDKLSEQSDSDSDVKSPSSNNKPVRNTKTAFSKAQVVEKPACDNNSTTPSPTSKLSKIPRLVTSPLSSTPNTKPTGNIKKISSSTFIPTSSGPKSSNVSTVNATRPNSMENKTSTNASNRLSRCDEKSEFVSNANSGKYHPVRPTSLPYRGSCTVSKKKDEPLSRRASSVSLNRKPISKKLQCVPKTVRTLTHKLPSDSGHLSFNENEKLKVVLEVDKTWLLCCRGNQKGLVPKSAVILDIEDKF